MYSDYLNLLSNPKVRRALLGDAPGVVFPLRFSNLKLHSPCVGAKNEKTTDFTSEEILQLFAAIDYAASQKSIDAVFHDFIPLRGTNDIDDINAVLSDLKEIQSRLEKDIFPNFRTYSCELIEESLARGVIEKYDFDLLLLTRTEENVRKYCWFFDVLEFFEDYQNKLMKAGLPDEQ